MYDFYIDNIYLINQYIINAPVISLERDTSNIFQYTHKPISLTLAEGAEILFDETSTLWVYMGTGSYKTLMWTGYIDWQSRQYRSLKPGLSVEFLSDSIRLKDEIAFPDGNYSLYQLLMKIQDVTGYTVNYDFWDKQITLANSIQNIELIDPPPGLTIGFPRRNAYDQPECFSWDGYFAFWDDQGLEKYSAVIDGSELIDIQPGWDRISGSFIFNDDGQTLVPFGQGSCYTYKYSNSTYVFIDSNMQIRVWLRAFPILEDGARITYNGAMVKDVIIDICKLTDGSVYLLGDNIYLTSRDYGMVQNVSSPVILKDRTYKPDPVAGVDLTLHNHSASGLNTNYLAQYYDFQYKDGFIQEYSIDLHHTNPMQIGRRLKLSGVDHGIIRKVEYKTRSAKINLETEL